MSESGLEQARRLAAKVMDLQARRKALLLGIDELKKALKANDEALVNIEDECQCGVVAFETSGRFVYCPVCDVSVRWSPLECDPNRIVLHTVEQARQLLGMDSGSAPSGGDRE